MTNKNKNQGNSLPEGAFASDMPMSEILAAIRKTIADPASASEKPPKTPQASSLEPAIDETPEQEEDILDLTDEDVLDIADEEVLDLIDEDVLDLTVEADQDTEDTEGAEDTISASKAESEAISEDFVSLEMEDPEADVETLMDAVDEEETAPEGALDLPIEDYQATNAAFDALTPEQLAVPEPDHGSARSPIESFVADMMRPLLREWLDEHLPDLVEKALQEELANGSED